MIEIILIAEAMLGIVTLFVFFSMAGNISRIKDKLLEPADNHHRIEYYKNLTIGDKARAYDDLIHVLISEIMADTNK